MNDKPASTRQIPFWLVLSLMANMALVGLLAGLLLRPGLPGHRDAASREHFAWVQPDERSEAIGKALRESFLASGEKRAARVEARKALGEAVASDPYDEAAVRAAFKVLREADDSVNDSMHEAMVKQFATLSLEDRQHVARFLMHGPGDMDRMRRMRPGDRDLRRRDMDDRMEGHPMMLPDDELPPPETQP